MSRWQAGLLRWTLTVIAVALLLGWGFSSVLLVSNAEHRADGGSAWMMGYGGFGGRTWTFDQIVGTTPPVVFELQQVDGSHHWFWFEWQRSAYPGGQITDWFVPGWAPIVMMLLPLSWLWRTHYIHQRAEKRKRRGLCARCSYARFGLELFAACPECGIKGTEA